MIKRKRRPFVLKSYEAHLYRWNPDDYSYDKPMPIKQQRYCTAYPGTQGQDWQTNYVYDLVVVKSQQLRLAYVECDYVQ